MATDEWYNGKSLAEDSHTINDSSMYDNTCSFSEVSLKSLEKITRDLVNETGERVFWSRPITYYQSIPWEKFFHSYAISDSYLSTSTTMPKFKKGDVIICNKDCNISGNSWKVEKGEIFYVQGADWNSYWVRVVYSDCGTKKDFSILAEEIDDNCSLYQQSEKQSSNSYFPNLSNV